jgi:hypothetical protein
MNGNGMEMQGGGGGGTAGAIIFLIVYLGILVFMVASMWKLYAKAGEPGWAAIVPVYNIIVLLKIAGRPAWWLVFLFIPFASLAFLVIPFDIAKAFGKSGGFGVGLLLLAPIFYPILAFGSAQYQGAGGQQLARAA